LGGGADGRGPAGSEREEWGGGSGPAQWVVRTDVGLLADGEVGGRRAAAGRLRGLRKEMGRKGESRPRAEREEGLGEGFSLFFQKLFKLFQTFKLLQNFSRFSKQFKNF
jgi:hypothetical protein